MSNRYNRLSELAKLNPFAAADHRNLRGKNGKPAFINELSREKRRELERGAKKLKDAYVRKMRALTESGAKFPADKILREFAIEYNNRYAKSGIYNQPTSFNYFEPFLHIRLIEQAAPFAEVENEFNHVFNATDFFDYATSADSNDFSVATLLELPQDQIFHFSTNGNVTDISFTNGLGNEFVISGFSMIRRRNSLYWYLIGGERLTQEQWDLRSTNQPIKDLSHIPPWKRAFIEEGIKERGPFYGKPISLEGTKTHIRTIIAGEFDLKEEKHITRCYLAEYENAFEVHCDDPEILRTSMQPQKFEEFLPVMIKNFNDCGVLWSLANGLFQLPSYFEVRLALHKNEKSKIGRVSQKKGGAGLNGKYLIIPSLDANSQKETSTIARIRLPHYEIETEGHWKKLSADAVGLDRHGNQIIGRTWIASSSKWKSAGSEENIIFLKDTIKAAKHKIADYLERINKIDNEESSSSTFKGPNEGELYIMRYSLLHELVFKVGYTKVDSISRAEQLSSSTGVPLAFTVLKQWRHKDAKKLETEVHMMLAPYRVNDSREFFMASFDSIVNIIETILEKAK